MANIIICKQRTPAAMLFIAVCAVSAAGQQIQKISTCDQGDRPQRTCKDKLDTELRVLAPDRPSTINYYTKVKGITDEHSSVFPPNSFDRMDGAHSPFRRSKAMSFELAGAHGIPGVPRAGGWKISPLLAIA